MSDTEKNNSGRDYEATKQEVLQFLNNREFNKNSYIYKNENKGSTINEQLIRKQKLGNDDLEQNIRLKKDTLKYLFLFLVIETAIIFLFAGCQAFKWRNFYLDEWSFRLLIGATITQITAMLSTAVTHLFPRKNNPI